MDQKRVELINKVKARIDEITDQLAPLVDVGVEDNNPIDTIINTLLDESAVEVLLKAPFVRLDITSDSTAVAVSNSAIPATGTIQLPESFLRLVSLRFDDWHKSVTELAIKGDAVSARQGNKHLRAGKARPVGVLTRNSEGPVIEYYSSDSHEIAELLYIERKSAEQLTNMQTIEAMCWICAARVLQVVGRNDAASNAYNNAQSLLM